MLPIFGTPPSFTPNGQYSGDDIVQRSGDIVLPCEVTGTPAPSVSWFINGIEINSSFVRANGQLRISFSASEKSHQGRNYYCIATNRIGRRSSTVAALRSKNVKVSLACKKIKDFYENIPF